MARVGMWLSLVERSFRVGEAGSSNLPIPTSSNSARFNIAFGSCQLLSERCNQLQIKLFAQRHMDRLARCYGEILCAVAIRTLQIYVLIAGRDVNCEVP